MLVALTPYLAIDTDDGGNGKKFTKRDIVEQLKQFDRKQKLEKRKEKQYGKVKATDVGDEVDQVDRAQNPQRRLKGNRVFKTPDIIKQLAEYNKIENSIFDDILHVAKPPILPRPEKAVPTISFCYFKSEKEYKLPPISPEPLINQNSFNIDVTVDIKSYGPSSGRVWASPEQERQLDKKDLMKREQARKIEIFRNQQAMRQIRKQMDSEKGHHVRQAFVESDEEDAEYDEEISMITAKQVIDENGKVNIIMMKTVQDKNGEMAMVPVEMGTGWPDDMTMAALNAIRQEQEEDDSDEEEDDQEEDEDTESDEMTLASDIDEDDIDIRAILLAAGLEDGIFDDEQDEDDEDTKHRALLMAAELEQDLCDQADRLEFEDGDTNNRALLMAAELELDVYDQADRLGLEDELVDIEVEDLEDDYINIAEDKTDVETGLEGIPIGDNKSNAEINVEGTPIKDNITDMERDLESTPIGDNTTDKERDLEGTPIGSNTTEKERDLEGTPFGDNTTDKERDLEGTPIGNNTTDKERDLEGTPFGDNTTDKERDLEGTPIGDNTNDKERDLEGTPFGDNTTDKEKDLEGTPSGDDKCGVHASAEAGSNTDTPVTADISGANDPAEARPDLEEDLTVDAERDRLAQTPLKDRSVKDDIHYAEIRPDLEKDDKQANIPTQPSTQRKQIIKKQRKVKADKLNPDLQAKGKNKPDLQTDGNNMQDLQSEGKNKPDLQGEGKSKPDLQGEGKGRLRRVYGEYRTIKKILLDLPIGTLKHYRIFLKNILM